MLLLIGFKWLIKYIQWGKGFELQGRNNVFKWNHFLFMSNGLHVQNPRGFLSEKVNLCVACTRDCQVCPEEQLIFRLPAPLALREISASESGLYNFTSLLSFLPSPGIAIPNCLAPSGNFQPQYCGFQDLRSRRENGLHSDAQSSSPSVYGLYYRDQGNS